MSTTESEGLSQEFPPGTRVGSGSANGRPICSRRARGKPQSRPVEVRAIWGQFMRCGTPPDPDRPRPRSLGGASAVFA